MAVLSGILDAKGHHVAMIPAFAKGDAVRMCKLQRDSEVIWREWTQHGLKVVVFVMLTACSGSEKSETPVTSPDGPPVETQVGRCEVKPPFQPNFEPELEWQWAGSTVKPDHKQVMMTPVVVDVNGDGIPDVVFNSFAGSQYTTDGVMRAISGADGRELWTVTDPAYEVRGSASIAAGDIDGDGLVELCTLPENGAGIICFENDGSFKFRTPASSASNWGGPTFADLDADGVVEIIDGSTVYSHVGTTKWIGSDGLGGPEGVGPVSFAVDIDQDGKLEVVNDRAIYKHDGSLKCKASALGHGLAGVGNFDADRFGEVVVVWSGRVSLMDDNCAVLWTAPLPGGGAGGPPNIGDFDNDGQPEIGVAGARQYSVFETNGSVRWSSPTQDLSSNVTGSSSFDFEGDGKAEVVYADETRLRIYDGATGTVRFEVAHSSGTTYENPVIVDVDGDDSAEIVIASNTYTKDAIGIRVYRDKRDGWVNTRRIWNQHAYSVTNVNDNGTIPLRPATNWLTPGLNTFRSNSQGSGATNAFAAPDLVVSNVTSTCDSDKTNVLLSARVRNQGDAAASAGTNVAFYQGDPASGGKLLGVAKLTSVLAAGAEATATLRLPPDPGGRAVVFARVDDDGTGKGRELECREDNNAFSSTVALSCVVPPACLEVRLSDYNLFLLGDYSGGRDVRGKVAAGGNISMTDFSVGYGLPEADTSNVLVAGGDLTTTRGGIWGDAWYGRKFVTDQSVTFHRGAASQGSPIDFAARGTALRDLSSRLAALKVNGTTVRESWGGITLTGKDARVNVFQVNAGDFTGAKQLSLTAPAGSLAVINVRGSPVVLRNFGHSFNGGIDQHGVLFNFVDATAINASSYGVWGTVLAPSAHITFNTGSWDGGIYALSLTGNAEGHINPLNTQDICP